MAAILKMVFVLSLLCGVSGFALSFLKISTATRIEDQVLFYVQSPAIYMVYPYAENNPLDERKKFTLENNSEIVVFPYKKEGKLIGVAIENFGKGYGGDIGVMVGFNVENDSLLGIGITTMKETPGIGSRISTPKFLDAFKNKNSSSIALSSQGGNIDSLGGATISSAGTVAAVQKASLEYQELKTQLLSAWN